MSEQQPAHHDDKSLLEHIEDALKVAPARPGHKEEEESNDEQLLMPPDIPG